MNGCVSLSEVIDVNRFFKLAPHCFSSVFLSYQLNQFFFSHVFFHFSASLLPSLFEIISLFRLLFFLSFIFDFGILFQSFACNHSKKKNNTLLFSLTTFVFWTFAFEIHLRDNKTCSFYTPKSSNCVLT